MVERVRDLESIREFLRSRGWKLARSGHTFDRYSPPAELGVEKDFWISVPKGSLSAPAAERHFASISKVLAQVYGWDSDNMERAVDLHGTVLSIRLSDDDVTKEGALPLRAFESILGSLRELLQNIADFSTSNLPFVGSATEAASSFIESCLFLQTERGSFITRIEIPSDLVLKQPDLLQSGVTARDATIRLATVLDFVKNQVMAGDNVIYEEDFIVTATDVLNVDVLSDVAHLFEHVGQRELSFHFSRSDYEKVVTPGHIDNADLSKLSNYIAYVRDKLSEEVVLNTVGSVVQLRSRNLEGDKNYVTLADQENRAQLPIVVGLDKERYLIALEAHRESRPIRIRGTGIKLKTQVSILQLDYFGWL
jgi:hypothetical protein